MRDFHFIPQGILVFGFVLMILGTYANLVAIDEKASSVNLDHVIPKIPDTMNIPEHVEFHRLESIDKAIPKDIVGPSLQEAPKQVIEPAVSPSPEVIEKVKSAVKMPPEPIKMPVAQEIDSNPVEKTIDGGSDVQPQNVEVVDPIKPESTINKEAIQKEDQEIAIADKEDTKKELKQTKELLEQVKDQLVKQNKETQKLVLEKIEKISQKVDKIEQAKDLKSNDVEMNNNGANNSTLNAQVQPDGAVSNTVVKMLMDNKNVAQKPPLEVPAPVDGNAIPREIPLTDEQNVAKSQEQLNIIDEPNEQKPKKEKILDEIQPSLNAGYVANPPSPVPQMPIRRNDRGEKPPQQNIKPVTDEKARPSVDTIVDGAQRDLLSVKEPSVADRDVADKLNARSRRDIAQNQANTKETDHLGATSTVKDEHNFKSINGTQTIEETKKS